MQWRASSAQSRCMMIMLVLARGRFLPREKVSREVAKEHSLNGGPHAMIIGSQAVAHKVIIVRSITRGDSQGDVRSAVLPDTLHHSVLVQ